jgi:Tfp pilus assembly protein PilN
MIRIDLAKDELQRSAKRASFRFKLPKAFDITKVTTDVGGFLTIVVAIAIGCLFPLFFSQYKTYVETQHAEKVKSINRKIESLDQEIAKLTPFKRELESYEQQKKIVAERLQIVRDLLAARNAPVNVLDAVGQSLPHRVWISALEFNLSSQNPTVSISGTSYSNEEISDLVDKLTESIYVMDVSLDDVSPSRYEDKVEVKTFNIMAKPKLRVPAGTSKASPKTPRRTQNSRGNQ